MDLTLKNVEDIVKDFPQPYEIKLIQSGFNYRHKNLTYSFYYSIKGGNKVVHKQKVVRFYDGQELQALETIMPNITITKVVEPIPELLTEEINKAQLCIDHLIRKKKLVDEDKKQNERTRVLSNQLKNLIDEFKQYL